MRSACFTGHRVLTGNIDLLKITLYSKLEDMVVNEGYTAFYAGGAFGWDTVAAETVLALRSVYPLVSLNLVLPCPPEEQTAKWNNAQKNKYLYILSQSDTVEIVCPHFSEECMKLRNMKLVEYADCCICFHNENSSGTGTAQTVRMAKNKNIPILNFFDK